VSYSAFKSALPRVRRWPRTRQPIGIRPLSSFDIDQAALAARQPFDQRGIKPKGASHAIQLRAEVLALALCDPFTGEQFCDGARGVLQNTDIAELLDLYDSWLAVQEENTPTSYEALEAEMQLDLRRRGQTACELGPVITSKTPADFFGMPGRDITDGQICYWAALRNAHYEVYERKREGWNGGPTTKGLERKAKRLRKSARRGEESKS